MIVFDEKENYILHKLKNNIDLTDEELKICINNPELKKALDNLIFIKPPPSVEQFLDPKEGWLVKEFVDSLYDTVKQDFKNIVESNKYYHTVCIYGCTRQGKSYLARLLIYYTIVYTNYLKNLPSFFGVSPTTNLTILLASFKFEKAYEIYIQPINLLLEMSGRMIKCKRQSYLPLMREQYKAEYIPYINFTNKSTHIDFKFGHPIQIVTGNKDILNALGSDLLQVYISEISYFIEVAGVSDVEIYRLYTDTLERIQATVGKRKLAFSYLDTSAYSLDNSIEEFIYNKLSKDKNAYYIRRSRWDIKEIAEKNCKEWLNTGKIFKVFIGDLKREPHIVEEESELEVLPKDLVYDVPIDYLSSFKRNLRRSICDILGIPTISEVKVFNPYLVRKMFKSNIRSVDGYVLAESLDSPEGLIFNFVKDFLLEKIALNKYQFWIHPNEERFIGLDLAVSGKGDLAAISCIHPVLSLEGEKIFFVDFSFPITAKYSRISFEAIQYFIKDLRDKAGLNIRGVSFETQNTEQMKQYLVRNGFECMNYSVTSRNVQAYNLLVSIVHSLKIVSGCNIFLKNNLMSLIRRFEKTSTRLIEHIDHTYGDLVVEYNGDFENSKCGKNSKDVSDSLVQAIHCYYQIGNVDKKDLPVLEWYSVAKERDKKTEDYSLDDYYNSLKFDRKKLEIMKKYYKEIKGLMIEF